MQKPCQVFFELFLIVNVLNGYEKASVHGIEIVENIKENIGNIVGDERKVKQVMYNLRAHALKFS